MLWLGAPTQTEMSALAAVRSLASRYPTPTNAVAVAALDSFVMTTAEREVADGVPAAVAIAFAAPDGILPRMRMLAWGWTKPGDKFRSPQDAAWWRSAYRYPLWAPLETLMDQLTRAGVAPDGLVWDDDLARGSAAELSRSLPSVIQEDAPPVFEAPCPKYIIPPSRGMMPILNPDCIQKGIDKGPLRDDIDKIIRRPPLEHDYGWLPWIALGLVIVLSRR